MFEHVKEPNGHEFIILKAGGVAEQILDFIREQALLLRLSRLDGEFAYVPIRLIQEEFPDQDSKRLHKMLEVMITDSFLRHSRTRFHIRPDNQGFAITEQGEALLAQLRAGRDKRIKIQSQNRWLFR